jgi:hypothetical protein
MECGNQILTCVCIGGPLTTINMCVCQIGGPLTNINMCVCQIGGPLTNINMCIELTTL